MSTPILPKLTKIPSEKEMKWLDFNLI
jgi:hypothetical protein